MKRLLIVAAVLVAIASAVMAEPRPLSPKAAGGGLRGGVNTPAEETVVYNFVVNVAGARISVDNDQVVVAPANFALTLGKHVVVVTAAGHKPARLELVVTAQGPTEPYRVVLQPDTVSVVVTSNVPGARVALAGGLRGPTPLTLDLSPGQYPITIQADGFEPLAGTLTVTQQPKQSHEYTLRRIMSTLILVLPEQFTAAASRGRTRVLLDGKPVPPQIAAGTPIPVEPGAHQITVTDPAGHFVVNKRVTLEAGSTYTVELVMDLVVNKREAREPRGNDRERPPGR